MLRNPEQKIPGWENPPYISFTSGYRLPEYSSESKDDNCNFVYALKTYPMSPNSNEISMQVVRNYVLKARDLVIEELLDRTQLKSVDTESTNEHLSAAPSTDNWFGKNEQIPTEYLLPSNSVSIEETLKKYTILCPST